MYESYHREIYIANTNPIHPVFFNLFQYPHDFSHLFPQLVLPFHPSKPTISSDTVANIQSKQSSFWLSEIWRFEEFLVYIYSEGRLWCVCYFRTVGEVLHGAGLADAVVKGQS